MGAIFRTVTYGNMKTDALKEQYKIMEEIDFDDWLSDMKQDYGEDYEYDGYSGTFREADGLRIDKGTISDPFADYDTAYKYLSSVARKWGSAIAVCYKADREKKCWMIGAWLSC